MFDFSKIKRLDVATVIPMTSDTADMMNHWLKECMVTGWGIYDLRTVREYFGEDAEIPLQAPAQPQRLSLGFVPANAYLVSFYDPDELSAKIAEIAGSEAQAARRKELDERRDRLMEFERRMDADPSPLDFRHDLK